MTQTRPSAFWVLAATILGSSLVFIDGTVVSIALPAIQSQLHASAFATQWVVEAYTLVLGALLLLCGALGDRYGRKRLFLAGVAVFAAGSVLCALAPTMPLLVGARIVQAAGGTMLAPASLALLGACFEGAARGKAIGTWSGLTAVASAVGPAAGGAIVDHFGWRWVFFINVPIAVAVVLIALVHVPESRDEEAKGPLDVLGSLAVTFALGAIVYAFVASGDGGWRAIEIAALVLGCACLGAFLWIEWRAPNPIVPLNVFADRQFSGINVMTFLLYGALGALFYFLPFLLIQVRHYDATATGLAMLPAIGLIVALSRFAGGFVYRVGARAVLIAGPTVAALGFGSFAVLHGGSYWAGVLPGILLIGVGMGLTVAPLTTSMIDAVPASHVGLASGINNAMSRVASLLAIAVFGALIGSAYARRLDARMEQHQVPPSRQTVLRDARAQLAGTPVTSAAERSAVGEAYGDAFSLVAVCCAALAFASAATAAATLNAKSR